MATTPPSSDKPTDNSVSADDILTPAVQEAAGATAAIGDEAAAKARNFRETAGEATESVKKEARALRDQAGDKVRELANQGKDRTTDALDNIAKLITDASSTVDERVGNQYGDYARKAADAMSGFATSLRGKEVDDIVKDAGDFVRKSPAVAIGAAAAVGFVLARLVKASGTNDDATDRSESANNAPPSGPDAV